MIIKRVNTVVIVVATYDGGDLHNNIILHVRAT